MPTIPTIHHVLNTLDTICYHAYMEPSSLRSHMAKLSEVLSQLDRRNPAKYRWLEASIKQSQLDRFTECGTQCGQLTQLCLLKVQQANLYNLCFTQDVDQCVCLLQELCSKPIELVAYGRAKLIPDALIHVLSDPHIQKNRWFPLTDEQRKQVVDALRSQDGFQSR